MTQRLIISFYWLVLELQSNHCPQVFKETLYITQYCIFYEKLNRHLIFKMSVIQQSQSICQNVDCSGFNTWCKVGCGELNV